MREKWLLAVDLDSGQKVPVASRPGRVPAREAHNPPSPVGTTARWRCAYCGSALTRAARTRDHVIPRSQGGTGGQTVPCCTFCNSRKASQSAYTFRRWLMTSEGRSWLIYHDLGPHRVLVGRRSWRLARDIAQHSRMRRLIKKEI